MPRTPNRCLRLTNETYQRMRETVRLARLLDPSHTLDSVLRASLVASGIQIRRRARAAGIDVEEALKLVSRPSRPAFDGVPARPDPRVY